MLLVVATPIAMVVALSVWVVLPQVHNANAQKQLAGLIELSTTMSALVHEQQKERGLSAVFLVSSGEKFGTRLKGQRALVDQERSVVSASIETQIAYLLRQGSSRSGAEYVKSLRDILGSLNKVDSLRGKVDNLKVSKAEAVAFYTDLNGQIVGAIKAISNLSADSEATASIISFAGFLQGKDLVGIERALGSSAVATGDFSNKALLRINGLIREQDVFMSIFLANATEAQKDAFSQVLRSPAVQTVQEMRDAVFQGAAAGETLEFSGADFFNAQTARINLLKGTEEMIVKDILQSTAQRRADAQRQAAAASVIAFLVISGSLAVTILLSRQVRRAMVLVSEAATEMAGGDLEINLPEASETELGQISGALDEFRQSILTTRALEEETHEKERLAELAEHADALRTQKESEAKLKEERREAKAVRQHEKNVANEISEVVAACAAGDFSRRLDLMGKTGVFLDLCRGVNQIGEATDQGLADISRAMSALSQGKLTYRIDQEYQGVFGEISEAVNGSMESLSRIVGDIRESGIVVSNSTKSLASAAEELSGRTERNAASLEEANAGLNELAASVQGAADGAEQVRTDAGNMVAQTRSGAEVVDATISAMHEPG
ncbi:MAG: HAMP domain-containing protein [Rhodobacteraceae bacterium]|nr:HAMP domain-containing protein [Paracoccaceae bacterium]